jgi:hypothetical protein
MNTAPSFSGAAPSATTLSFGSSTSISLPSFSDAETDDVTITKTLTGGAPLPIFITASLSGDVLTYTVSPSGAGEAGTFSIETKICDWEPKCSSLTIQVIVTDTPVFSGT